MNPTYHGIFSFLRPMDTDTNTLSWFADCILLKDIGIKSNGSFFPKGTNFANITVNCHTSKIQLWHLDPWTQIRGSNWGMLAITMHCHCEKHGSFPDETFNHKDGLLKGYFTELDLFQKDVVTYFPRRYLDDVTVMTQ